MRTVLRSLFTIACFLCISGFTQAQVAGNYNATGYFFHPSAPRAINLSKVISQVGPNTYQVDFADLGPSGYAFTFDIDATNHLINWVPVGATPSPGSGFMTADNPGNINFNPSPASLGYTSAVYNNTYNPATNTFYLHYGYVSGGANNNQNAFTRQVYEKLVLVPPAPGITSVSPINITEGTLLTINGTHLTGTNSVVLGNFVALNNVTVVNDNQVTGTVGKGASGPAAVQTPYGTAYTANLVYTAPPVPIYPWRYVGTPGFSPNVGVEVSIAAGPSNVPYIAYRDLTNNKTMVMKLVNGSWAAVGGPVSDGASRLPMIVMDKSNTPWVAYIDSVNGAKITVKHLAGGVWTLVGAAGVGTPLPNTNPVSLAVDTTKKPYLLVTNADGFLNVLKFNNNVWANVGGSLGFKPNYGATLTIDEKTNRPYVAGDDAANGSQVAIQKFDGSNWVNVGTQGFTTGVNGVFYPDISTDKDGNPFIAMQEDNGPEDISVYAFKNGNWAPVGNKFFTGGHTYYTNLALDTTGTPSVLFIDNSNYQQGSVMQPNPNNDGTWQSLGQRGFATAGGFRQKAYIITANNTKYIAFTDRTHGNKVTVMQYFVPVPPVITSFLPTTGSDGDVITVKGKNFIGTTASAFGGVGAAGINIQSDSVALLTVGPGASGAVSITTPAGTATKAGFTYCRPVTPSVTIVSAPAAQQICAGTPVKFTATAVNGGNNISYQWKKNNKNVGTNNRIYNDTSLTSNDSVWCVITGNAPCATSPTAVSNVIKYKVNPLLNPAVILKVNPGTTICAGTPVVITAQGTSLGDSITYQWRKNNKNVGSNQPTYADETLKNGDTVWVVVKINSPCATPKTITTPAVKFTVNPVFNPSVTIAANPGTNICINTHVTFTATPVNAGDSVTYQWWKNTKKVGTSNPVYVDSVLKTNDSVWVVMTAHAPCATPMIVNSNVLRFTVNAKVKPTITIGSVQGTNICAGVPVTINADAINAGELPTYQWKKNNTNVGTNSNTYTDSRLVNGDSVYVVLTVDPGACAAPTTVASKGLKFKVTPSVTPTVTVAVAPGNTICAGTKVSFTATATNGGNAIVYKWRKNNIVVGTNSKTYLDSTLANGDKVTCTITSNVVCRVGDTVISEPVVFNVSAGAPATPASIKGSGSAFTGQSGVTYSVLSAGADVTYNWTVPAGATITAGMGTRIITVTWGSTGGAVTVQLSNICGSTPVVSKTVNVTPGFAGNTPVAAMLYPNPATTEAHLSLSGYHGNVVITVSDLAGKLVQAKLLAQDAKMMGRQQYTLQVGGLSAGVYIVTIKDGTTVNSFKLVKAK